MSQPDRKLRDQLTEARQLIEQLLRVIDRHLLGWTVWPEDTQAMDEARQFVYGPHNKP